MRRFVTPLFEVSAEISIALQPVAEFRGRTFYEAIKTRCPGYQQLPVVVVPPELATPEQIRATPAIYRFFSNDNVWLAFYGPRMAAANVRGWPGYADYRAHVEQIFGLFFELAIEPVVERYSLGFYNRVPIGSAEELKEVVSASVGIWDDPQLSEMVCQSSRMTDVGSVLTQMVMQPGDQFTPEPYLAINNIIRNVVNPADVVGLADLLRWLDEAHEVGKEFIWKLLSDKAKESWKASNA